jgi:predicted transcriptional regulator
MSTTTVGVKLDDKTRTRLRALGDAKRRSTHWMVKEAVARYLDVEERYERERVEDLARWQSYVETGHAIPHETAMAWLDDLAAEADRRAE